MNKLSFVFFSILLSFIYLIGCKDPDVLKDFIPGDPDLVITVNGFPNASQVTLDVGDTLFYSVDINAPAGIEEYEANYTLDGTTFILDRFAPDTAVYVYTKTEEQMVIDYTLADKELEFYFVVRDTADSVRSHSFILNVNPSPIVERIGKIISPYEQFVKGNLYNAIKDTLYHPINVKTDLNNQKGVDLIMAYEPWVGYFLSSPSFSEADSVWEDHVNFAWPFLSINTTQLIELDTTAVDYNDIVTATQLEDLFTGTTSSVLTNLYTRELIAIKLDGSRGGKIGLMKITGIVGGRNAERQITFNLKLEQ
ncbi:MAG: hypothetical protein CMB80_08460 [Flammeovirgaceae bacterium]|nr:hypothetical protein [Flammeovirgaceae bacterium]MBR06318.1 hypothetical protein [Rickettsiales bacterium]|tara:strand:+ start:694 stop:1620 length:927 start_codon:yes stop_codon:yes gene_type:complete